MAGVVLPSVTPLEGARSGGRILAGEYRADYLAETVISKMATQTGPDGVQPLFLWSLRRQGYVAALHDVLASAHPSWPNLVDAYLEGSVSLDAMWPEVVRTVDQTLTLMVHAQAMADAAGDSSPIFDGPALRGLPALDLYLAEPFNGFPTVVRGQPIIPPFSESVDDSLLVSHAGEALYMSVWARLGIHPRDLPRPDVYLDVTSPAR